MSAAIRSLSLTVAISCAAVTLSSLIALAQTSPPPKRLIDPEAVPDDMLPLVVGTRFVKPSADRTSSAPALFNGARIPLSAFNETDHCVDQSALEVATEYFTALGRALGKAGYYYFVPEEEIRKSVAMCERLYHRPPQAWVDKETVIVAFGRVVPTVDAPALEKSIR